MADVRRKIIFDASMNIAQVKSAVENIQQSMANVTMPKNIGSSFERTLAKLSTEIVRFEQQASQGIKSVTDFKGLESSGNKILRLFQDLQVYTKQLSSSSNLEKMMPPEVVENINKAKAAFKAYEAEIKKSEATIRKQQGSIEDLSKDVSDLEKKIRAVSGQKIVESSELTKLKKQSKEASDEVGRLESKLASLNQQKAQKETDLSAPNKSSSYRSIIAEIAQVEQQLNQARVASSNLSSQLANTNTYDKQQAELTDLSAKLEKAKTELTELQQTLKDLQQNSSAQALQGLFDALKQIPGLDMSQFEQSVDGATQAIQHLISQGLGQASQQVSNVQAAMGSASHTVGEFGNRMTQAGRDVSAFNDRVREMDALKYQIQYFFGITNVINLFRRAVTSAFNTVKELDAVMTEIAVVSEFNVSDMWNKLPEFTEQANQLGVAVKEAYSATTLFVQQGLNLSDSMELSTETLKMARIAGMDAAAATDAMTAALRGFNMELSETSAQRVNDVYSKLAAITASDTQEISTAMTKTASIAHNANMEFETTAAFLSQIIETTRESAETAGTAMKTVIARFQELKKDPSEIGEIDGEIVDANKIETALRTIGVSLRDARGQFRDLDEVFLEIASKWDSLDTNTQRYIATMAAGSRQQSRFIAMMSNYDRTMDLVNAANNSAGASQEQFEKTLESLQSRLAELKNAWDEFAMGLANSEIIKFGVDLLTGLLTTVNKVSDAFGDVGGAVIKLISVFALLKGGKMLFNSIFSGSIGSSLISGAGATGAKAGLSFGQNFAHKLETTKLYSKKTGSNLFKSFFMDTKNLILPEDLLKQPLSKMFNAIDPKAFDTKVISNALQKTFNNAEIDWSKSPLGKEQVGALIEKGDIDSLKQANAEMERLGATTNTTKEMVSGATQDITKDWKAVGSAIAGAGMGLMLFGNQLQEAGFEKAGKIISKLGTGLMTLGMILSITLPLQAKIGAKEVGLAIKSIPIIGWIAAIISALITLGSIIEDLVETSAEKAKRLNEEAKAAQAAAEAAKSAYEELLSSFDEYDTAQEALEKMIRGTDEWRQALIDVNNQVIELLKIYPELSKYIQRGADGQLEISGEGRKEFLKKQEQGVIKAQQAAVGAEVYKVANTWDNTKEDFDTNFYSSTGIETKTRDAMLKLYKDNPEELFKVEDKDFTGSDLYKLYQGGEEEKAQKIWETEGLQDFWGMNLSEIIENEVYGEDWLNKNIKGLTLYSDALYDIAAESEHSTNYLYGLKDSIAEYRTEELANEAQMRGYASSILGLGASEALTSSDYSGQIQDIFADTIDMENFDENIEGAAEDYSKDYSKEDLKEKYLEKTGLTELPQEIADGGEEALANALAEMDVLGSTSEAMNNFYKDYFNTLSPEKQDSLIKTIQKDGKGFTRNMMKAYQEYYTIDEKTGEKVFTNADDNGILDIDEYFKKETGLDLTTVAESMDMTVEEFRLMLVDNAEKTEEAFTEATARLTANEIDVSGFESKLSAGALAGLSDHIYQTLLSSGSQVAQEMSNKLSSIMENLSPEQAEKFANALNTIDWTDQESIRSFGDLVKELGIETGMSEAELAAFEEEIISLNNATKDLSFDKVKEQIKSLQDLANDIENREGDFTFTDEDKNLLVGAGISEDQFVLSGIDEWIYIGGSLESLLSTIDSNTAAILAEMTGDLNTAVERGQQWERVANQGSWSNGENESITNIESIEGLINGAFTYIDSKGNWGNSAAERGYDIAALTGLAEAVGANITASGETLDLNSFDEQGIIDLLAKSYNAYYGPGGSVLANNEAKQQEIEESTTDLQNMNRDPQSITRNSSAGSMSSVRDNETLLAQARLWGVNEAAIQEYKAAVEAAGGALTTTNKAILANAISNKQAESRLKKTSSSIAEIIDNYEDLKDVTDEDIQDIGMALGLDDMEVGGENFQFIQDNLALIDKAMRGDIASMNALQAKLAEGAGFKITGEGDFSAVNEDFDITNQKVQDFIKNMIAAGMFEVETVEIEEGTSYIKPIDDNGDGIFDRFEQVGPVETKQTVQVVKPVDAPSIKNATGNYTGKSRGLKNSGSGSGRGGGDKKEPAENDQDWLYNLMQDINAEMREREKIERRYSKLLEDRKSSGRELYEASQEELASLEKQKKMQEDMLRLRKEERGRLIEEKGALSGYVKYNAEDNTIEIDWDAIDKLAKNNPDKYEEVSDYIGELEDVQDKIEESEEALWDIEDAVEEIKRRGEDEYVDLETRILDALVEEQNKIIENQEEINESINNAAEEMVEAIRFNVDKLRQDRENEDTEESLAEKERRLAYLRQDTSGANAMEIKRLEEEIANEREAYGDSLVDQALQDLQTQNDEAADQRERQIKLMQEQLTWGQKNGYYAAEAHRILQDALTSGGTFDVNSRFYQLLYGSEGWEAKAHSERLREMNELQQQLKAVYEYMVNQNANDDDWTTIPTNYDNYDYMEAIKLIEEDFKARKLSYDQAFALIQKYEAARDMKIDTKTAEGITYGEKYGVEKTGGALSRDFQARYQKDKNYTMKPDEKEEKVDGSATQEWTPSVGSYVRVSSNAKFVSGAPMSERVRQAGVISGKTGGFKVLKDMGNGNYYIGKSWTTGGVTGLINKKYLTAYKTGGLADFTGPAWLDGTKSRPEMVLNAQDTENFLVLKDILSSLLHLPTVENTSGDNYFDINIQVDEISDDYDVDQMVERVKQKIYEDSMYRNNNSINLLR